jgi:CheY-like chemotaxis protein
MRILIVEDDEDRRAWFRLKFADCDLNITGDVQQAFIWLAEAEFNLILLDHDLIEDHYFSDQHDDERTGYAVATWLALHPDRQRDATITIHSLNYLGAERMLDRLRESGRDAEHVPFQYMLEDLRY